MALTTNRAAVLTTLAAAASMVAMPAAAVELPIMRGAAVQTAYDGDAENAAHRRWRRNRGVDAGDIIAGVLVLGGIAAIASAAGKKKRDREDERYRTRYPYPEDARYRERSDEYRSSGMDRAVDMCVAEVERGRNRVGTVDNASRTSAGWMVSGELDSGALWSCRIDNDGRVRDVDVGDNYSAGYDRGAVDGDLADVTYRRPDVATPAGDEQWSDAAYARARERQSYGASEEPEPGV